MKIIGITGGVGSGKSRVLSYMEEQFDAVICQADHVAWELEEPGQKCYIEIVEHFGREILPHVKFPIEGLCTTVWTYFGKIISSNHLNFCFNFTSLERLTKITWLKIQYYLLFTLCFSFLL